MSININVSQAAIAWLGKAFQSSTKISPFSNIPFQNITQEDYNSLLSQGVLTPDNRISPVCANTLAFLAAPSRFTSVTLSSIYGKINRNSYFSSGNLIMLDNFGDSLRITDDREVETFISTVAEVTGSSKLVDNDLNMEMGYKATLVFASLFDLTRKTALLKYSGISPQSTSYGMQDIYNMLNTGSGSKWLCNYIKAINPDNISLSQEEAQSALNQFIQNGVAARMQDNTYSLAGDAFRLASNFLIIENVLNIRCGDEDGTGQVVSSECMFLQAGIHDILMLDVSSNAKVGISSVSGSVMTDFIRNMLANPPALR